MYIYQGQSVATYEQLVPVLKAKNSKQLSNIYYAHKEDLTQDSDIFSLDNNVLYEFRRQNDIVGCRRLHLFTVSGAHKLAKFGKLDSSRINEVYGVITAKEDVKPVESIVTQEKKVNASYSAFEIVDGSIRICRQAKMSMNKVLTEQHECIQRQSELIEKQKELIEKQNQRNDKKNEVAKDISNLMIKLKQLSDEAVVKTIELLQY